MTTRDQSGNITGYNKIYVLDGAVRHDQIRGGMETEMTAISTKESLTFLYHAEKRYTTFNEQAYATLESFAEETRQRIEDHVKTLPEEQQEAKRAELHRQWFGVYGDHDVDMTEREFRATGSGQWNGTPCSRFAIMRGGEMVREVCVVPFQAVIEDEVVIQALRDMAVHMNRSASLLPQKQGSRQYVSSLGLVNDVDGFPVITREVMRQRVISETELGWVTETYVDPEMFEVPEGYSELRTIRMR